MNNNVIYSHLITTHLKTIPQIHFFYLKDILCISKKYIFILVKLGNVGKPKKKKKEPVPEKSAVLLSRNNLMINFLLILIDVYIYFFFKQKLGSDFILFCNLLFSLNIRNIFICQKQYSRNFCFVFSDTSFHCMNIFLEEFKNSSRNILIQKVKAGKNKIIQIV